jgi:hypothetical protein
MSSNVSEILATGSDSSNKIADQSSSPPGNVAVPSVYGHSIHVQDADSWAIMEHLAWARYNLDPYHTCHYEEQVSGAIPEHSEWAKYNVDPHYPHHHNEDQVSGAIPEWAKYNVDPYYPHHHNEDQVSGAIPEPFFMPMAGVSSQDENAGAVPSGIAVILQMLRGDEESVDENNNV